jgi:hypothetical protein
MSAASQLKRSFEKYRAVYITLLECTDRQGELEALKQRTFQPLKVLYCYWNESTNKDYSQGGESQEYTATIRILTEDISDIADKVNQYCRVVEGVVTDTWLENKEWMIETILPKRGQGNFRVLEMTLKLPKDGNQVRL